MALTNALFFDQVTNDVGDPAEADDDSAFAEIEWFEMGDGNEIPDPAPFTVDDCQAEDGPNDTVKSSEVGAFSDGAEWMDGLWVDRAIE